MSRAGEAIHARMDAAGFTLVELLVGLLVAALLAIMLPASLWRPDDATTVAKAAAEIEATLRRARAAAIAGNRPAVATFDLRTGRYAVDAAAPKALGPALTLRMRAANAEILDEGTARIRFHPDGSSSGGRITITGGTSSSHISIDWLTGRVSLQR